MMIWCDECGVGREESEADELFVRHGRGRYRTWESLCRKCKRLEKLKTTRRFTGEQFRLSDDRRSLVHTIRITEKCQICGTIAGVLDFHHVDSSTKVATIQEMVSIVQSRQYTFRELIDELSKCCVLCHSCHASLHVDLYNHLRLVPLGTEWLARYGLLAGHTGSRRAAPEGLG